MARRVFYSFHYNPDNWRASKVRNMGVIEGNRPVSDNSWEKIKRDGKHAIENWIAKEMKEKSCTIVLIGEKTAGRKWIKHEIEKTWNDGKGLVGIYIHNLENKDGNKASKGRNPFEDFTVGKDEKKLSSIVKAYNPPYQSSKNVYNYINKYLEDWVEEAIDIRNEY